MVMIRVTQNMVTNRSLTSLQAGLDRLAQTQEKLSTGKNLNRPSDSPTDATTSMKIRVQLAETQQHVRNAQNGLGWLDVTDTTLSGMADNLRRVGELALQGANASITGSTSAALATEVAQIREGLLAQANTTYLDRPIFGGVTAGTQAFDASGAYVGADAPVQRSVADGVKVRIDVSGTTVVGPNGDNLFDDLAALESALRLGDKAGIQAGIAAVTERQRAVSDAQAAVGASYNRVDAAERKGQDALVTLRSALSEVEDTDLPKAMVDLQMHEVAYQAALASTARVMQPSLVDFLR
ncbi:flagellar hook-associated protein FlgL [Nocardioides marinus]|uniref:Flagellar hook-associated protein 3 FlgL n=1 Tax=Nocardioides marinus TaxID=374514 RepID=A0A7Y9YAX2_9ACTN|nr:flagellar hook-associated protein FlgL [Nocardioides marinus]NYI08868.1 flagellar hook-associated protein 3 FlgL [Nocardioides marinus]